MLEAYSQVFIPPGGEFDGKSAGILRARRGALLARLPLPTLVQGPEREPGAEFSWWSAPRGQAQDPEMVYLTGINQPGFALFLDPTAPEGERETLFVPARDLDREFWNGLAFGMDCSDPASPAKPDEALAALTGIGRQLPAAELPAFLDRLAKSRSEVGFYFHQYGKGSGGARNELRDDLFDLSEKLAARGLKPRSVAPECLAQRVALDEPQLRAARRAQEIAREAFAEWLPRVASFADENEAFRSLEHSMLRRTPWGLAFPTIAAGGANACVLHYVRNDAPLDRRDLLLVDFGARWGSQSSDVTRTVPVGGKFDPLQRILYGVVLDAQEFHRSRVAPGRKLRELDAETWAYLEKLLKERFFDLGGRAERPYDRKDGSTARPHGVSHLIGETVHDGDPFRLYMDEELRPGMTISNEPGLYGSFEMEIDGALYRRKIGIRIENDLLLTESGCEDLSAGIPSRIEEIEALLWSPLTENAPSC